MKITVTPTPAAPPTLAELLVARQRYQRRVPAQRQRCADAVAAVAAAKAALDAALAEEAAANRAAETLDAYIADLTAKIGK